MTKLDFDELNELVTASLTERNNAQEVVSDVRGWLIGAFQKGIWEIDEEFEFYYTMHPEEIDRYINHETEGKTYADRIEEYWHDAKPSEIKRVVETEFNRAYNQGRDITAKEYAKRNGVQLYKKWHTMVDPKVRDTHSYLESEEVPASEEFYTFDGDHAMFPGGFTSAENNCNCRCFLTYSQGRL